MAANNHSATHLLHYALRKVLGTHVEQKGSLVTPDRLRFDFSHFSRMTREELQKVEEIANQMVRNNYSIQVTGNIHLKDALSMGAMALFGEKYGETVRVVQFGDSVELCGGTHVDSTARIGLIKIVSEGAIAAGVRRIEAITGSHAAGYINEKLAALEDIAMMLKSQGNVKEGVEKLLAENSGLRKSIEKFKSQSAKGSLQELLAKAIQINNIRFISGQVETDSPDTLKFMASELRKNQDDIIAVIGSSIAGKVSLLVVVSDNLVNKKKISAAVIIREISPEINGGGGGQPFLATAGGKNPDGIAKALRKAEEYVRKVAGQG